MTATTSTVRIIDCTTPAKLFHQYPDEFKPQPAYIELDLRAGTLLADYDSEIGNAVPFSVHHGFERRYTIPVLTAEAANRVMREIAPLADRILADWDDRWDGNNTVAVLGKDAQAAEEEIEEALGLNLGYGNDDNQGFADSDLVAAWDIDGAINGLEAEEYDITAETTDERLDEIEAEILTGLASCGDSDVVVCSALSGYLRGLRDQAIADAAEDDDED
ncbi:MULTISPECIES: hypothetical protein [unclassified Streptomyces]|uniref:hypothetical protein n=1 Tax=unclassified Streptomyces TaxID=2593676 RepID=UPI0033F283F4